MAIFGSKKEEGKTGKVSHARVQKLSLGKAHEIIRAPWFSEKALLGTDKGVYAFAVSRDASKADIAGAIKEIYNVEPKKIHIVNLPSKKVSLRTRRGEGSRAARHKAYVYLNKGDTITFA
jgi:ribosomal protein L23